MVLKIVLMVVMFAMAAPSCSKDNGAPVANKKTAAEETGTAVDSEAKLCKEE